MQDDVEDLFKKVNLIQINIDQKLKKNIIDVEQNIAQLLGWKKDVI